MFIGDFPEILSQQIFYMRNIRGWLETRLAQNTLNYLKHHLTYLKQ